WPDAWPRFSTRSATLAPTRGLPDDVRPLRRFSRVAGGTDPGVRTTRRQSRRPGLRQPEVVPLAGRKPLLVRHGRGRRAPGNLAGHGGRFHRPGGDAVL